MNEREKEAIRPINKNRIGRDHVAHWLFAGLTMLFTLLFWMLRLITPFDGARQEPGEQGFSPLGLKVRTVVEQSGGLKDGDIVTAVDGRSLESWAGGLFRPGLQKPGWHVGDAVRYSVIRDGENVDLDVRLMPYPLALVLGKNWSLPVFVLFTQIVISLVFVLKPGELATRSLFIWAWSLSHSYVWSLGLQVSDLTNPVGFWIYHVCTSVFWLLYWGAFLSFIISFPRVHPLAQKFPRLRLWSFGVPTLFAILFFLVPGSASNTLDWLRRWTLSEWFSGAMSLLLWLLILLEGYRFRFSLNEKKKARWIFLSGIVCGGLGFALFLFPAALVSHPIIHPQLLGLLLLPFPIFIAIAVVRYQLFDIDIIIRRTLIYSLITISLSGIYFGCVLVLQQVFRFWTGQESPVAVAISTLVMTLAFNPLRLRIQRSIDRRFYRDRYDTELALNTFSDQIRDESNLVEMSHKLIRTVEDNIKPSFGSLWLASAKQKKRGSKYES